MHNTPMHQLHRTTVTYTGDLAIFWTVQLLFTRSHVVHAAATTLQAAQLNAVLKHCYIQCSVSAAATSHSHNSRTHVCTCLRHLLAFSISLFQLTFIYQQAGSIVCSIASHFDQQHAVAAAAAAGAAGGAFGLQTRTCHALALAPAFFARIAGDLAFMGAFAFFSAFFMARISCAKDKMRNFQLS